MYQNLVTVWRRQTCRSGFCMHVFKAWLTHCSLHWSCRSGLDHTFNTCVREAAARERGCRLVGGLTFLPQQSCSRRAAGCQTLFTLRKTGLSSNLFLFLCPAMFITTLGCDGSCYNDTQKTCRCNIGAHTLSCVLTSKESSTRSSRKWSEHSSKTFKHVSRKTSLNLYFLQVEQDTEFK